MKNILNNLKKNDRSQNQLALYYLFEYGKQTLKNEREVSKIKENIELNNKDKKNPIMSTEFLFEVVDIANEMAKLSENDLCKFIYEDVKEQKKQERSR